MNKNFIQRNLRETLKPYLVEWPMTDDLDPRSFEINRMITQLDDVAVGYEAKWGIYYLEAHAPTDLAEKWQRQVDKLNDAIAELDVPAVRQLVDGCIRGYKSLETAVEARMGPPKGPVFFEYKFGSMIYRIVKNVADARALHKPGETNVRVLTGEEACRIFDRDCVDVFQKREGEKIDLPYFDFDKGDSTVV